LGRRFVFVDCGYFSSPSSNPIKAGNFILNTMSKKKTMRYRIRENQPDLYNKTYSVDEEIIEGGTNGYDGHINDIKRIKIKKDDLTNLIIFAVEQGILTEQKKQKRQQYNKLKLAPQHFPKNKRLEAELFSPADAYEATLSEPAKARLKATGSAKQIASPSIADTPF